MGSAESFTGVSRTALGVARIRAVESARTDRLFDDPFAGAFVEHAALPAEAYGEKELRGSRLGRSTMAALAFHIIIRTRFYDDFLLDACTDGGRRQVVVLAAGLDTRAFRLDWPAGVRLYEIDLPEVLAFKDGVLTETMAVPRCERTAVPADLRGDWADRLVEAGFRPDAPTAWLAEGILVYLEHATAAHVLTTICDLSADDSRMSCEQVSVAETVERAATAGVPVPDHLRSMWKGGLGEDVGDWLAQRGWTPRTHPLGDVAESYGRPVRGPTRSAFLTATRGPRP